MKCEIIRDLLPSYIDGLTSMESNIAIEEHTRECAECKEVLAGMKADINTEHTKEELNIQPFLKMKKDTIRKLLLTVFATASICALGIDVYYSNFHNGVTMSSHEVEITYEKNDNIDALNFLPKEDGIIIRIGYSENKAVNGKMPLETISLIKYKEHPVINPGNESSYQMYFVDEDTVMYLYSYPDEKDFEENDFIAIEFNDVTKIIKMSDLREGNIEGLQ